MASDRSDIRTRSIKQEAKISMKMVGGDPSGKRKTRMNLCTHKIVIIFVGMLCCSTLIVNKHAKSQSDCLVPRQLDSKTPKSKDPPSSMPQVLVTDRVYHPRSGPLVIPEYKLIFVTFPKVACSEWKRMFMRMNNNPLWCLTKGLNAHDPDTHKLKYLADYPPEVATAMMTSPAWTRAAFVREPKERVLSAFLDKAVKEDYFARKCCKKLKKAKEQKKCAYCRNFDADSKEREVCTFNPKNFENFLYYVTKHPKICSDVHWEGQEPKIDKKWWPYINFVGFQDNLQNDAKRLLQSLYSNRDKVPGRSAWDRYGASGWGVGEECENRTASFLEENTSTHKLDTGSKLDVWYSAKAEKIVEEHWSSEWELDMVKFPKLKVVK